MNLKEIITSFTDEDFAEMELTVQRLNSKSLTSSTFNTKVYRTKDSKQYLKLKLAFAMHKAECRGVK